MILEESMKSHLFDLSWRKPYDQTWFPRRIISFVEKQTQRCPQGPQCCPPTSEPPIKGQLARISMRGTRREARRRPCFIGGKVAMLSATTTSSIKLSIAASNKRECGSCVGSRMSVNLAAPLGHRLTSCEPSRAASSPPAWTVVVVSRDQKRMESII